jgi:hypothetical protein
MQRVDRRDLDAFHRPRIDAGHDDAVPHIVGGELRARLQDDLATVSEEQDGLEPIDPVLDDGAGDLGLAGSGRRNEEHLAALAEGLLDAIGRIDLIGAKRDHDTRPRNKPQASRQASARSIPSATAV